MNLVRNQSQTRIKIWNQWNDPKGPKESKDSKDLKDLKDSKDLKESNVKNWRNPHEIDNKYICGFLIFNQTESRVLLVVGKESNLLGPPKGHLEINDKSYIDTAIRETKEETGIDISNNIKHFTISSNKTTLFVIKLNEDDVQIHINDQSEISSCNWYDIGEIINGDKSKYNSPLRFLLKFDYLNNKFQF